MPSTATITAFYSFTAGNKARASQVNSNFSIFRGHIIPIEPLTETSADITYDLGSSEYRWRSAYLGSIDFDPATTTSGMILSSDTTYTLGSWLFKIGGTTRYNLSADLFSSDLSTSTGYYDFKLNGNTAMKLGSFSGSTSTAATGGFALSSVISASFLTTSAIGLSGSTVTISTIGHPVSVGIMPSSTNASTSVLGMNGLTTGGNTFYISILRDGSTVSTFEVRFNTANASDHYIPVSSISTKDFVSAGTYVYSLSGRVQSTSAVGANLIRAHLYAHEVR